MIQASPGWRHFQDFTFLYTVSVRLQYVLPFLPYLTAFLLSALAHQICASADSPTSACEWCNSMIYP